MKRYKYLIFDADHTLLNYILDERGAFERVYNLFNTIPNEETLAFCRKMSEKYWKEEGLYDVHSDYIQREYHTLYRTHLTKSFSAIFEKYPLPISTKEAAQLFLKELEHDGVLLPEVDETLSKLSDRTGGEYCIIVATNGLSNIQRMRLKPIEKYIDRMYISEEVGVIKPLLGFFEKIFSDISKNNNEQIQKSEILMIGDSLFSDIAGANAAGIDSCWLDTRGMEKSNEFLPTYTIKHMNQILEILRDDDET